MAPRPSTRRERNNDYSAVGTAGRRTGVTLPQAKLDENGLEEITGLFSSPVKPSPMKQIPGARDNNGQNSTLEASEDMLGMDSSGMTPTQTLSARRSLGAPALPPPRSASPRKSGISGTPRRSNGIDILSPSKAEQPTHIDDQENSPSPTPIRVKPRRFMPSPDKRALKEVVPNGEAVTSKQTDEVHDSNGQRVSSDGGDGAPELRVPEESVAHDLEKRPDNHDQSTNGRPEDITDNDDSVQNPMGDEEIEQFLSSIENTIQDASPVPDPEPVLEKAKKATNKIAEKAEPKQPKSGQSKAAMQLNKSRKRKSEDLEKEPLATSSKHPAKKPRAAKGQPSKAKGKQKMGPSTNGEFSTNPAAMQAGFQLIPARQPGLTKDPNTHLSQRQQAELDQIIEKVKARPGKLKTLYVLKREKSKQSGADAVRSGRAVIKPVAYWSAEECVHRDSEAAAGLELGTRIPLSSVTEIPQDKEQRADSDSADDDPHEESWERDIGIYRGHVAVWSPSTQTALLDTEETELAHHPSSMLTREVRDAPGVQYAKLLSMPFFGSGIVDLAPGAMKKPKLSRAMHMCFFVFRGRVQVVVGRAGDVEEGVGERFSVGTGGMFQVPRGNRYSIENVLDKPARIFFSQASETVAEGGGA